MCKKECSLKVMSTEALMELIQRRIDEFAKLLKEYMINQDRRLRDLLELQKELATRPDTEINLSSKNIRLIDVTEDLNKGDKAYIDPNDGMIYKYEKMDE